MEESIFRGLKVRISGVQLPSAAPKNSARAVGLVASYAVQMAEGPERSETVFAVTGSNQLVSFNAGRPSPVMKKMPIANLRTGESIMGIDFRPADGRLYALASSGRLEWSNGVLECWSTGFPTTQHSITPVLHSYELGYPSSNSWNLSLASGASSLHHSYSPA